MRAQQQERSPTNTDRLREIGARLAAHVRLEENELFPYIEESLESRALDELGARIAQHG